jgi:probable HAF family extracellular repeat protein
VNHAFLYSAGTITDLGTLNGGQAQGYAINDAGVVVGTIYDPANLNWSFGFVYSNGVMTALPNITPTSPTDTNCRVSGINDAGVIAGSCAISSDTGIPGDVPILYVNGTPQVINPTGGAATAINSFGQVAGSGFIYYKGAVTTIPNVVVPTIGPTVGVPQASSINNAGQVVGTQQTADTNVAFFYSNGTTQTLPLVANAGFNQATSVNNAGQVVGYAGEGDLPNWQPFFYANGMFTNLNALISPTDPSAPYVTLQQALGINDSGVIVASGIDSRVNILTAYVLTPVTPYPAAIQVYAPPSAVIGTPFTVSWTDQSVTSCAASGGVSGDAWGGSVAIQGGQQQLSEAALGHYSYTITCQSVSGPVMSTASVDVVPPSSVSLTAAPSAVTIGQRITLTWSSVTVSSCTATGGSNTDSWNGARALSGSLATAEGAPGTYTYVLTCAYGTQVVKAQAAVSVSPPSGDGGGGALDLRALAVLLGLAALRTLRATRSDPR